MRTTYTGPVKNRGLNKRGQANVSREELEDFKRKHGQDKTLRDLLNADRTGKTPPSEKSPLARGKQGASMAPSRTERAEIPKDTVKAPSTSTERRMSPMEMGLLTTAGALGAPLAVRGAMKVAPKVAEMASKAAPKVAGMASKAGEAVKGAASKVSDAVKGMMGRRAAAKAAPERKEPVYDIPPMPPKHSSLRSRIAEREANKKDGGTEMGFKKGGMTKGGGCETRGKKARYI
jgi:hypothetical protein